MLCVGFVFFFVAVVFVVLGFFFVCLWFCLFVLIYYYGYACSQINVVLTELEANPEVCFQIWVSNSTSLEFSVEDKMESSVLQAHVKLKQ